MCECLLKIDVYCGMLKKMKFGSDGSTENYGESKMKENIKEIFEN